MKLTRVLIIILLSYLYALSLQAQLYEWTDEKGVKHYSNVAPSESAPEVKKRQENTVLQKNPYQKQGSY